MYGLLWPGDRWSRLTPPTTCTKTLPLTRLQALSKPKPAVRPWRQKEKFEPSLLLPDKTKIVRENSGKVNPERIEEYIAVGGYQSLYKALYEMTPAEVVDQISKKRPARTGRRRLPHRFEVGHRSQNAGRSEIHYLQRRRGRPRCLYGPQRAGERPPTWC